MSTTQRSESMNNELKRYISIKYDMVTFFHHFERLLVDKRFEEVRCDFKATQTTPKIKTEASYMLRQAATTYTPAIFKMFQEQVLRTLNYDTFICDDSDIDHKVYKVNFHGTQRVHVVRFFPEEEKINCSCKKFEFAGILCSHCLKVLDINNIKHIPEEYILKRWTIGAKVLNITSNRKQHEDPKARMSNRYKELCKIFTRIAARAAESDESYDHAANCVEQLALDVEKSLKIRTDPDLGNSSTSEGLDINTERISKHNEGLGKPLGVKVKEKAVRGSRRPVGGFEKATGKKKKSTNPIGHLEFMTNQMGAYQLQYNPFLNASMQPSLGSSDKSRGHIFTTEQLNSDLLTTTDNWDFYFYYDGTTKSCLLTTEQLNSDLLTETNHWALYFYYDGTSKSSLLQSIEAELINILYRVLCPVSKQN
ncbi:hypothetical protein ACQ4PT_011951 [Festuca glaucescens]